MNAVVAKIEESPRAQTLEQEVQVLENRVTMHLVPAGKTLVVTTAEQYRDVAAELVIAKAMTKKIEETRLDMTRPIDAAKANVKAFFDRLKAKPEAIVRHLTVALDVYDAEQRRVAAEAQRRLDEEAERQRKFNEQRAARAVERGDLETAQAVQAAPPPVAPVVVAKIHDVKGLAMVDNWIMEISDADKVPREWCSPDEGKLRAYGKLMKDKASVPGVTFRNVPIRKGVGR